MTKKFTTLLLLITFLTHFASCAALCAVPKNKTRKKQTSIKKIYKTGITKNVKKEESEEKKEEFQLPEITDDAVEVLVKKADKSLFQRKNYNETIITDEPVIISNENRKFKRKVYTGKVNTEIGAEVILKPVYRVSTKSSHIKVPKGKKYDKYKIALPEIGERIPFKVTKDVIKDNKVIIKKDTIVYAKIAEVSPRAMGGAPAEMTIEGFEIKDENGEIRPLDGSINTSGYSLSFWIGLAELATTPFLFGIAVPILRVLPGGQAAISPRKAYVVYY